MNSHVVNLEHQLTPIAEAAEELAVDNLVVTAAALPALATHVEISVKGNAVRYTLDGTDPVSDGVGAILVEGIYYRRRQWIAAARFIESAAGSDGVLRIQSMAA